MNAIFTALIVLGPNGSMDVVVERANGLSSLKFGDGAAFHSTRTPVQGVKEISVPGSQVRVVTWNEGPKGFYAVSLNGQKVDRVAESSTVIRTIWGEFDPLKGKALTPTSIPASPTNRMFLVQFGTQPLEQYKRAIEKLGATFHLSIPDHTVIVDIPADKVQAVREMPFVRWVGKFEPSMRIEQEIQRGMINKTLREQSYYVQTSLDSPELKNTVAAQIQLAGGQVVVNTPQGTLMEVVLKPEVVAEVAKINGVLWLERKTEPSNDMDNARITGGANTVQSGGVFEGQDLNVHVIDGGIRRTHVDYASRLTVRNNPAVDSHGTATSGIVTGDGTGNPAGKGMLPKAGLVMTPYQTNWSAAARLALTQDTVNVFKCVLESNSWGDALTGSYTAISSYMDEIVYKTDLLILNSMSNWGTNTQVRPQAWAKNVFSIGGFNHFNNTNDADDRWQSGASIGPAADGRIKPELAHYYDSIFCTTSSSDTAYTSSFGGTSAATPITAGHAGIVTDMWTQGHFGNSVFGATKFDRRAASTTIKAIMMNQAFLYQNVGDIVRNVQGWGRAHVGNVNNNRERMLIVNETDVLTNLATKTYQFYVDGTQPFRATMTYNDYWAAAFASVTRQNEISLKVTSPGGTVYWGNNGMTGTQNWTQPGGSRDARNNTQNVFVQNPTVGLWTVEVTADNLVQDGRPSTPELDADYALVISGGPVSTAPTSLSPYKPGSIKSGGLTQVQTSNNDYVVLQTPLAAGGGGIVQSGVIVNGVSPLASPSTFKVAVESFTNLGNVQMKVDLWNWQTSSYETVNAGNASLNSKALFVAVPPGDPSRFVETGTNAVRAAVYFERNTALPAVQLWATNLDHVRWFFQ
ncbi:MAG: S8 family serine peptidase [Fimbriimonadaceae bacterium]|nr:S8 family serine peptidase [Fimbriimonadaceae bacterium]QYK59692.1 MAG: S8 family serine peptidase [Fimbriimonadaceae bacterium]